jgi:hypothetical protein
MSSDHGGFAEPAVVGRATVESTPTIAEIAESGSVPPGSALELASGFIRAHWQRLITISTLVLIPCFWHREIEATDLGSHLYNAWLVQLIERGQIHGLWIEHRWNNILFDYLLSGLGALFSLPVAEKIAVSIAVLIFFWGAFAFVCAATRRASWYLVPSIAMAAYGWTFELGFFNYYIALGLSFWALAVCWRGEPWERLIALALVPLVALAHPLGLFWLVGALAYIAAAEQIPRGHHALLLVAGISALFGIHEYLWHHYVVEASELPFYYFSGADQFLLFSSRYRVIKYAFLVLVGLGLLLDAVLTRRDGHSRAGYLIPAQLYVLVCAASVLLPRGVRVPGHIGAIALLTDRLTTISAILLCCLMAAARPRKWHFAALTALAGVFFGFVYQDTGKINRMEREVEKLVRTLPPNQRVLGTILPPEESRIGIQHILDRACIGYCFSYGNYEPGSRMFRVRALPGNPYVLSDYELAVQMEDGYYTLKPADLPAYQVYQCGQAGKDLCIHRLEAEEENDDLGVHPDE